MSVATDAKHRPAAVATPEPLDDTPLHRVLSHGFTGTWNPGKYGPYAPSHSTSLPRMTAPAASSRVTTVASKSDMKSARTFVPAIVRTPRV